MLSEVRFLETFLCHADHALQGSVLVYMGAADGMHISWLIRMYPSMSFVLVDPERFHKFVLRDANNDGGNRIRLIQDCWDAAKAEAWLSSDCCLARQVVEGKLNVFFVSDIRKINVRLFTDEEGDDQVLRDHDLQDEILNALLARGAKVVASMVKFRAPYTSIPGEKLTRIKGELWVQPYAPRSSTELRLTVGPHPTIPVGRVEYDPKDIEGKMYYINTVLRPNYAHDYKQMECILKLVEINHGEQAPALGVLRNFLALFQPALEQSRLLHYS